MREIMMFIVILLPVVTGIVIPFLPFKKRKHMEIFLESFVILNSLLVFWLLMNRPAEPFTLAKFTGDLTITFKLDGMGMVFSGLVSALWPLATLYAFEYMTKEEHEKIFFTFYTMTFGVTLGIALAGNMLTMYFFYELLTLVTVPLVMHTLTREAILASRKYLYYSLGGAAFAFIGLIFIIIYGNTTDFILGGVLNLDKIGGRTDVLLLIYVMAFMGFGVKAAICPFNSCHSAAPCSSGGKGRCFCHPAIDLLQFWNRIFEGNLGTECGDGHRYVYHCLWLQPGGKGDPYQEKAGLFHHQQSVLYFIWCSNHDTSGNDGSFDAHGFPRSDEDLLFLLCRSHYASDR